MKRLNKLIISLFAASLVLMSCDSLLDVDSERFIQEEEYRLSSPADSLYSMMGVLTRVQKLADTYVLLGELRGDLLDVTENADLSLKEINNFEISDNNPYADISVYYSIINNCNYIIKYIDTTYQSQGEKVLVSQFVQAKTIRAWTYLQLVLNYGSAQYYDEPILSVEEAEANYPVYDLYQLADALIKDLTPWKNVDAPVLGSIGDYNLQFSFFPVKFVLGDLYLWTGDYLSAAQEYHDLMLEREYSIQETYQSFWVVENEKLTDMFDAGWSMLFSSSGVAERITDIATSSKYGNGSDLYALSWSTTDQQIIPSDAAISYWNSDLFFQDEFNIEYDLRGPEGSYYNYEVSNAEGEVSGYSFIEKYYPILGEEDEMVFETRVYRNSVLYLRYAEAVNRLGKPNLALAVLKNGLSSSTLNDSTIVPKKEKNIPLDNYMDFTDLAFRDNIGTVMRGQAVRKYVNEQWVDARDPSTDSTFVIPALANLDDSVTYVEDVLVRELALETAFEGNRFHDLMRVALRRGDNAFLADRVAKKHTVNKEAIRTKLLNEDSWYLPKP